MARAKNKKPNPVKRATQIVVRLTEAEKRELCARAAAVYLPLSSWARMKLLN